MTAHKTFQPLQVLALTLAVSVGLILAPQTARAQWASEITQGMNNAELVASTKKLKDQYDNLTSQLDKLKEQYEQLNPGNFDLNSVTGFRDGNSEFKERSTSYGMSACKKGRSDVGETQLKICKKRVEIENMRFNAMVKMLKDVKTRDDEIQRLMSQRKGLNGAADKGKLDANTNDIARLQTQMENDIQNGKYTLDSYTAVLDTLNDEMVATAKRALKNEGADTASDSPFSMPPIVGKVLQGAALKIGLKAAESRDL
ncbi:hypothetical protein ACI2IY_15185 [Lysobacter enzymogenes]|uniref:hypothetical protein n=1 Tax=Lysobacter enzymogenes TaxID=69 RepID=UPI00384A5B08